MGNLFQPLHIIFLLIFVSPIALLFFFAIRFLSRSPQAEREAYYHAEMIKKIAESGAGSAPAVEYLREQERIKAVKRLGGIKLAGLINIAVGLALILCLSWMIPQRWFAGGAAGAVGLIPLFIGVALLVYAFWLAPKPEA
jgi:predicted phage tail protein